jgi:nucleoside-diphosphate-sugar epimerase
VRILLSGATGFIGRRLAQHLVGENTEIVLLLREEYADDRRRLPPPLLALRPFFTPLYADLRNLSLTRRAVADAQPDVVIHLAAAGVSQPYLPAETALRHNLTGTINLARACFESDQVTRQLIVARTPGELAPTNTYHASKAAAWAFCDMFGRSQDWPIHGAMIFQCYGPGQPAHNLVPAALMAALSGHDLPITSAQAERDWIYVDDVVNGLAAMAWATDLPPGTTVELGSGVAMTVAEAARRVYEVVGRGGRPLLGALPDRPGEALRHVADPATWAAIAWRPRFTFAAGLEQWLRETTEPQATQQ